MALPAEVDAVVIGGGSNGLVAANRLADAGWDTLLLEAQPDIGGAVRSDRELHPHFVQDTFSAFYPMAAASPVIRAPTTLGSCCTATSRSPRVCSTPSTQGTAQRGGPSTINGRSSDRP